MREQFGKIINSIREYFTISNDSETETPLEPIRLWVRLTEWAIIFVIVLLYFSSYLTKSTVEYRLPGNEEPLNQSYGQILTHDLQQGYFPLWNPYVSTGFPFSADPLLYIYNPFIILPMLLFGYVKGFVYAVLIAILIGAYGMWWLARQFGLGSLGRTWAALMFILAGVLIIRFIQGQYLQPFGYGWLPWGIATILRVLRFGRLKNVGVAAIILALLYFCGGLYYSYFMLFVGALATIIYSVDLHRKKPYVNFNLLPIRNLMLTGALIFGLVSIQLIPLIEFSPRINKAVNLEFTDSHNLPQILLDYTSKDTHRPDAIKVLPPEDFYAYLGWWPFLALIGLPFAWQKKRRRMLLFFIGVFILSILWIDIREMPWREVYRSIPLLYQFRAPPRFLAIGTLSLILLGGFGLDNIWKSVLNFRQAGSEIWRKTLATGLMLCMAVFMLVSIGDLFNTNGKLAGPAEYYAAPDQVLADLRNYDPGTYYISAPTMWHEHTINYGMRYWDAWFGLGDMISYDGMINQRGFVAGPKYRITGDPVSDNSTLIMKSGVFSIYRVNSSLPFAFSVPTATLMRDTGQLVQPGDVIDQPAITKGPNQVEINVNNDGTPSILVVLTENYPGWQISVDGKPAELVNVSGYIGTRIQPGQHRYVFSFQPLSFYIGLIITLISLLIVLGLLTTGRIFSLSTYKIFLEKIKSISWLRIPKIIERIPEPEKDSQTQDVPESEQPFSETELGVVRLIEASPEKSSQTDRSFTVTGPAGEKIQVQVSLNMPVGTRIRLTIEALENDNTVTGTPVTLNSHNPTPVMKTISGPTFSAPWPAIVKPAPTTATRVPIQIPERFLANWERLKSLAKNRQLTLGTVLFSLALIIYLFTRLYGLQQFPIFFFGDEAVQSLYAERLIANHFIDANGMGIPIYVEAAPNRWTPLVPMYFHAISILMFGKSILETRATSVVVTLLAVASIGLSLKFVFKKRYWWAGVLVASIMPAWFLHSRTAFETAMSTSFYGAFLLFYLLYRYRHPRFLYAALVFAALTFYSYSNAQAVMAAAGLLLLLSDIRYHWENRKVLLNGFLLALILAAPIINFELEQPQAIGKHLQAVNSYWLTDLPLTQKIWTFISQYFYGLSPQYWVFPNSIDLSRHRMDSLGHILFWLLPFIVIGLLVSFWKFKQPMYRTIILVMLATPIGGAMVHISITRVLTLIIPVSILAILGFEWSIDFLRQRWMRFPDTAAQILVFICLASANLWLLNTALVHGPFWDKDYGLYGMQWGAEQIFVETVPEYLKTDPNVRILMSSSWANGTDNFVQFFVDEKDRPRVFMAGIQTYMANLTPIGPDDLFMLTPGEYNDAVASKKFDPITIEKIINYPDGNPGFYFVRLTYAKDVEAVFAAEKIARMTPVVDHIQINGQDVTATHSKLDSGQIADAMDGNLESLMRGQEANPFLLEFAFSKPRSLSGFAIDISAFDYQITYDLYAPGSETPVHYERFKGDVHNDSHVEISFDKGPAEVQKIVIRITNLLLPADSANIHIREIKFMP